jgi:hypothetical protein
MSGYLDAVLASRLLRGAYATAALVSFVFLWGTAVRVDQPLASKAALVVGSAALAIVCAWMAVAPGRERGRLALRGAGLIVSAVTCGLTVAGLGAFDPPRREFQTPSDLASLSDTADVLRSAGFTDAAVTYPRSSPDTILVRYAGGPLLDQPGAAEQVAGVVWTHEGVRFQTLTIQSNGASVSFSYQELAGRLPPRPSGLDSITIAQLRALAPLGPALMQAFDDVGRQATHGLELFSAGLIATFSVVAAAWTGLRRTPELAGP